MIEDILSMPEVFEIDGIEYKAQFDCKSYGILENITQKSIYKIQDLIADNNLFMQDSIELICASLIKNHSEKEISELREKIKNNLSLITVINMPVVTAFFKGISPPEIFEKVKELHKKILDTVDKPKKKAKKA